MNIPRKILFLLLALSLLLPPLMAGAMTLDPGECPKNPTAIGYGPHDWVFISAQEANCQHPYRETYRCSYCGKTETVEYGDKTGHDFTQEVKQPTCTADGYQRLRCTVCGEISRSVTLPATGHKPVTQRGKDATCTKDGYTASSVCGVCGTVLSVQEKIPALGHDWGRVRTLIPATCVERGMDERKCIRCGEEEYVYTDYGEHDWGYWRVHKATCTEPGVKTRSCRRCDKKETETVPIDPTAHDWGEWVIVRGPTGSQEGLEECVCKNNSFHILQQSIPAVRGSRPAISVVISADVDAGIGQRYKGGMVTFHYRVTNIGQCPVYIIWPEDAGPLSHDVSAPNGRVSTVGADFQEGWSLLFPGYKFPGGWLLLYPGESYTELRDDPVFSEDVERGCLLDVEYVEYAYYFDDDGTFGSIRASSNKATVPLTYPLEGGDRPALTLSYLYDDNWHRDPYPTGTDTFEAEDVVYAEGLLTNSGNVPLEVVCYYTAAGVKDMVVYWARFNPGDAQMAGWGGMPIGDYITPGTETDDLLGVVTISFYYVGYDPASFVDKDNPGTPLCRSETITRAWNVRKKQPHADISLTLSAEWDAGEGKRYVGEVVTIRYEVTNTGDCPVYTLWLPDVDPNAHDASAPNGRMEDESLRYAGGVALLNPGETFTAMLDVPVTEADVINNHLSIKKIASAKYYRADGELRTHRAISNELIVHLTYLFADSPGAEPGITLTWLYDSDGKEPYPDGQSVFDPDDSVYTHYALVNSGNVFLTLVMYARVEGADEMHWPVDLTAGPGESFEGRWYSGYCVSDMIEPGTGSDDLSGLVNITMYCVGYQLNEWSDEPETDKELCRSNVITRTLAVKKPEDGPIQWTAPEESQLAVRIERDWIIGQNDPAGLQLTEDWYTAITVENTGTVDVDAYTLHVDFAATGDIAHLYDIATDGASWYEYAFDGGIPAGKTREVWWTQCPHGVVFDTDVARGYVMACASVRWTDPDSGRERVAYSDFLVLPVIDKTGLVLQKSVSNTPANGRWFTAGETVAWKLTVTNNSAETIYHVAVSDRGEAVGAFDEIAPGETKECAVPGY